MAPHTHALRRYFCIIFGYALHAFQSVDQVHRSSHSYLMLSAGRVGAGKYNDLATAFMSNQDETIKHIFSLGRLSRKYEVCKDDNCYFTLRTLFILTATYWVFMVLLGGIVIPGGLFMPSIMVMNPFSPNAEKSFLHAGSPEISSCTRCS